MARTLYSDAEIVALAQRITVNHLRHTTEDWLLWEDVPELGEYEFERLCTAVSEFIDQLAASLDNTDRRTGIDSRALLAEVE